MVTGWAAPRTAEVTSERGRMQVDARCVILATGARERPRTARRIPGDRPAGVLTTGQLQNLVHLHHANPGSRAVVVGAELVSWSAVMTLREAGCSTVALLTEHEVPESYAAFRLAGRVALRTPVRTRTKVECIIGSKRVEGVKTLDMRTGRRSVLPCDTVVFTGDWIPDHELVRLGGIELDPYTLGPRVDTRQSTSEEGVFAIGNLTHPVDTADIAALDGRAVANEVLRYLTTSRLPAGGVTLQPGAGLAWVSPSRVETPDAVPPRARLLSWPTGLVRAPRIVVSQGGRIVCRRRVAWPASPGRVFRIPYSVVEGVDPAAGPCTVSIS
jgi:thioredoxin reductase